MPDERMPRKTRWVALDVVMTMLDRSQAQVYRYAAADLWTQEPGSRPARYDLQDVNRTYRRLNPPKGTP